MVKCMEKGLDITIYVKTHLESSASIFYLVLLNFSLLHGF